MEDRILTTHNSHDLRFLKKKAGVFDFSTYNKKEIHSLLARMKQAMRRAKGIGLSANQIGLPYRVFVAEIPDQEKGHRHYAIFNPHLEKISYSRMLLEEGCLSVPGVYGKVERAEEVVLCGFDKNGKPLRIKAWGLVAHVFQHEVDHLDGKLFIQKADELYDAPESTRLKQREKEIEQ